MSSSLRRLLDFLRRLELAGIDYHLESVRDAVMVIVAVPGERWEIEFFDCGRVEVERFTSSGVVEDESLIEALITEHASG